MLGQSNKALETLEEAQNCMEQGRPRSEEETKLNVEMLTDKLIHSEKLSTKTIVQMNKAAVMLCQGNLPGAKNQLDELLEDQNIRVIQTEPTNSSEMIPDYLIKLLVYFMLTTSKYYTFTPLTFLCHFFDRKLQDGEAFD